MSKSINSFNVKDLVLINGKINRCYYDCTPDEKFDSKFSDKLVEITAVIQKGNKFYYNITDAYGYKEIKDTTVRADSVPQSFLRHNDCRRMYNVGDYVLVNGNIDKTRYTDEIFLVTKIIPNLDGKHKYDLYKPNTPGEPININTGESYMTKWEAFGLF